VSYDCESSMYSVIDIGNLDNLYVFVVDQFYYYYGCVSEYCYVMLYNMTCVKNMCFLLGGYRFKSRGGMVCTSL
jgi:hypothetical protein